MNIVDMFSDTISQKDFCEINLNEEARIYLNELGAIKDGLWLSNPNPLIDPGECEKFLQYVHTKYKTKFSYGGYGEDRSTLWHDTYLDQSKSHYHIGTDINVSSGTTIVSPVSGIIITSDHDSDHPSALQVHGWGNRLIIQPHDSEYAIILAHLSEDTRQAVGNIVSKGQKLGTIGTSKQNGGWFEHFHVQSILRERLQQIMDEGRISELDGYAPSMNDTTRTIYPNVFTTF